MTPTPRHRAAADLGELITVFYQHFLETVSYTHLTLPTR